MKKFLLACAAAVCAMTASAQSYTVTAVALDDEEWNDYEWTNMLTPGDEVTVEVDAEGQSVTLPNWIGSGMDLILCYNDDEEVTSIIPVIGGVEGTEVFADETYGDFLLYFPSDFTKYYSVSLLADYCGVGVTDADGYVFLGGYLYTEDSSVAAYYSVEWENGDEPELVLIYDTTATPEVYEEWGEADEFFLPATEVAVGVYEGNQIVLDGWTGSASDIMLIKFDDEDAILAMTEWTDGEAGETVTSGYGGFNITNDDYYYCSPYIGDGYSYAFADEEGGYVIFGAYFYPADGGDAEWLNYYVEWDHSGITSIEVSKDLPVEFYNINGMRVDKPSTPGLYIQRQGDKAVKTIIR